MNRRDFLKLSGLLGVGLSSLTVVPAWAESVLFNRTLHKVTRTRLSMGTFVTMTAMDPSRDRAEEAIGRAFEETDRLTRLMNRFDDSAAVAHLNKEGSLKDVPPEVGEVLVKSQEIHRITGGYFDISVKPVVDLFKDCAEKGNFRQPSESRLKALLDLVDSDMIELTARSVRFRKPGMGITLDGIAKGYIVDRASDVLTRHGITNHLINAGGDIRAAGLRDEKKPWTVAIQDPNKGKNYPDIIQMSRGAIATSGNYEVYFDREKLFHHIINPSTGLSPVLSTSVSILAETAILADALATGVFVMGPEEGRKFLERLPGCEGLIIGKDGRIAKSSGWKSAAI
ncbi:MAG: FAD:protein FMN transferase [Desulfobacteraceae bacterium]|jgi:thiamine biosynthesis lipoprotein|nr:MAG: FAD:protein FMN transferase [Desulfobacteraceae bacterium]